MNLFCQDTVMQKYILQNTPVGHECDPMFSILKDAFLSQIPNHYFTYIFKYWKQDQLSINLETVAVT